MLTTEHCVAVNYEAKRKTEKLLKTDHKTTGDIHPPSVLYCQQEENRVEPKGSEWWLAGLRGWRAEWLQWKCVKILLPWLFIVLVWFFFGGWSMMDMESSEEGGTSWEH